MKFIKNMETLKELFPQAWKTILEIELKLDKDLIQVGASQQGNTNFQINKQFLHDNKNPEQEAAKLIQQFHKVKDHSDILFYGIGMGYHIIAFADQYPNTSFSVYEPIPEVFYQFLCHADLKQIPLHLLKNIYIENHSEEPDGFCNKWVKNVRTSALVIDLPSYQSIFPKEHKAFFTAFEKQINERRISVATNSTFQKRWTINSIKNFINILNSPDILLEKRGYFKNKPAILVSSGPSLEDEIDNLRLIKEKGLAYVFTAGTAINTLVQHEVYPDAACTYDPTEDNQIICKEVLEKGIKSIPLIFGSTVGYESLDKYPGPKIHMLIGQDTVAAFYLKPQKQEGLEFISDATTIAVITFQLLCQLGFNPIILVGQNLAYRDRKSYAAGSTYHPHEVSQQDLNNAVLVKDVYGKDVATNHTFVRMRQQLEIFTSYYKDLNVINTTKFGAHIENTIFQNLNELIKTQLNSRVIENDWLEFEKLSYDMEYLIKQSRIMSDAHSKIDQMLQKCKLDLDNIGQFADSGNASIIGQSYETFNLSMDKLRNNQFFATFITPMNRVELEFLILTVPEISKETNPVLKAEQMERHFRPYLLNCEQDILFVGPFFQEINQSIQDIYRKYSVRQKAARTKVLLVDIDGVLTDGTIYFTSFGDEMKKLHYKDLNALLLLKEKGIRIILINPESNPLIKNLAGKLGIHVIASQNRTEIITTVIKEYDLDCTEVACIFNEMCDLEVFKQIGLSFAVRNATMELQSTVDYVLAINGGRGAIMEIVKVIGMD